MSWSDVTSHFEGVLLVLMFIIFCGIAVWAYSPHARKRMDESAHIPMHDDR